MRAGQSHNRNERPRGERSGALARVFKDLRDGLMASAYPEQCRVCGAAVESYDDGVACEACWSDSHITRAPLSPACDKCGGTLARQPVLKVLCGTCAEFPFSAARACGAYGGALEANILFLKSHAHICRRLQQMIFRTFQTHSDALDSDLVMPVPLHHERERERGFNQAGIIARLIARKFNVRLDDRSLVRVRPTERHRVGLDAMDRKKSVERAFTIVRPRLIENLSVLLVDDLFTTGSTLSAASQALLEAGAHRVNALTIARVEDRSTPVSRSEKELS